MLLFITHLLIIIGNIFAKTCQDSGGAINPVNAAIMRQELCSWSRWGPSS